MILACATTTAPTAEQEWTVNDMRLIDADALLEREKVNPFFVSVGARNGKSLFNACLTYMAVAVDDCPTIDAVPVVRCKDCKHYVDRKEIHKKCCYVHLLTPHPMPEDGFCSYGERRKDG